MTNYNSSNLNFDFKSLVSVSIERKHLTDLIASSLKVLLVSAPSGFGKTFLLAGYLNSAKKDFLYYELSASDNNLVVFISSLLQGCGLSEIKFNEISALIQNNKIKLSRYSKESYDILKIIVTELFIASDKKILIIENCDFIKNELWFKHFIKIISELMMNETKFIFTGIELSSGIFLYAISKGIFSEIRKDKFELSVNEIKKFADKIYNIKLSDAESQYIKEIAGGWITGLHLIFHNYESGIKSVKGNNIHLLNEYFKEEVLSLLDKNLSDVLLKSSFFDEINESVYSLVNLKTNINDLFKSLTVKIPFIYYNSASDYFYFNKTFKLFLQSELKNNLSKKEFNTFISSVANYYYEKKNYSKALELYILSSNYKSAILLISSIALIHFRNNDFHIVNDWFSVVDKNNLKLNEDLIYIKALLYKNYFRDNEYSVSLFKEYLLSSSKNNFKYYKAIAHVAEIYLNQNEIKSALSFLKKSLLKCPQKFKPFILFRLHSVNYKLDDYQKCKSILSEALNLINKQKLLSEEFQTLKMNIINAIGNIHFMSGELNDALVFYKKVYDNSEVEYNKIQTLLNMSEVYSKSGNYSDAKKIISELKSDEKINQIPELNQQIIFSEIKYLYEFGEYKKMNSLISQSEISQSEEVQIIIMKSFLINCDYDNANLLIKKLNITSNGNIKTQVQIYNALLQKKYSELNKFLSNQVIDKNPLLKTEILSIIVITLIKKNNLKQTFIYLSELKKLIKKINYENIILNFFKLNPDVYDTIIIENIESNFFREIYQNIKINDELFSDVFVKYFGVPEIYVRGNLISDKMWKRNKFKDIFLYLYFNLHKRVTKDEILDRFYPESDKNYGDNIFHQFLSAMRNVLTQNVKNKRVEFIKYSNKIFEPDKNYIYNSDVEILKLLADGKKVSIPENYQKEICSESFMKNYFDDFAESNREYFSNLTEKINSGR
ncbi:MAG TPA: tetratricopeptide repeat protein [Ignavibacteria bacterium]|nr:tetratricopeptide repeat protein [Ignavibacteria bacterium]